MYKTKINILEKTIELLSNPKKWTRNSFAKDKYGNCVDPLNKSAISFCVSGAITKCGGLKHYKQTSDIIAELDEEAQKMYNRYLTGVNDCEDNALPKLRNILNHVKNKYIRLEKKFAAKNY